METNILFDDKIREIVETEDNGWMFALTHGLAEDGDLLEAVEAAGYSRNEVINCVMQLRSSPTDKLIVLAVADELDDSPALGALQVSTSREVFEQARELCRSDLKRERRVGIQIIMRDPGQEWNSEAVRVVRSMCETEVEAEVLEVLAYATKHLNVEDNLQFLHRLVSNSDEAVRFAAAYGLGGERDDQSLTDLIALSRDPDDDVRNWATFGLHLGKEDDERDRPDVRNALVARLTDSHDETRHEAIEGLALYRDERVLPVLIAALQDEYVWFIDLESAEAMGHPDLYPSLISLQERWKDESVRGLAEAIESCRPK